MKIKDIYSISEAGQKTEGLATYSISIGAGFPSPADGYVEKGPNLQDHLIKNQAATYMVRVEGDSMRPTIFDGDELLVDRSLDPISGKIVIASWCGELLVKRLIRKNGKVLLKSDNEDYETIDVTECADDVYIWGVITWILRKP